MELKKRDSEILNILIAEYIAQATPIGSKTLSSRFDNRLSSATVRNILADLEEKGFLTHPHVSAGRMPTEKGFRYYVDSLLAMREPSEEEVLRVRAKYEGSGRGVGELLSRTSKVLSSLSRYAALVMVPRLDSAVFKHMEFIPLSRGRLLGIFVTQDGIVQNRVVELGDELTYMELEKISNYCNKAFYGLSIAEARQKVVREMEETEAAYDRLITKALILSQKMLIRDDESDLIIDGESKLLTMPEFSDVDKIRKVMEALEEKRTMLNVLERTMEAGEIQIFIGSESKCKGVDFCSMVTAPYKRGGEVMGTIGVIGPKRMDYQKTISVVDCTAKLLSELLEGVD